MWTSVVVAPGLLSTSSVVVAHGFSCSKSCGIFPDQGLNPCPLQRQVDSFPLSHEGSPTITYFDDILLAGETVLDPLYIVQFLLENKIALSLVYFSFTIPYQRWLK